MTTDTTAAPAATPADTAPADDQQRIVALVRGIADVLQKQDAHHGHALSALLSLYRGLLLANPCCQDSGLHHLRALVTEIEGQVVVDKLRQLMATVDTAVAH